MASRAKWDLTEQSTHTNSTGGLIYAPGPGAHKGNAPRFLALFVSCGCGGGGARLKRLCALAAGNGAGLVVAVAVVSLVDLPLDLPRRKVCCYLQATATMAATCGVIAMKTRLNWIGSDRREEERIYSRCAVVNGGGVMVRWYTRRGCLMGGPRK